MPDNIIEINELIKSIEECGYIDCNEYTNYVDGNEYESILWYLKQTQSIINDIRNMECDCDTKNYIEKQKKKLEKKVK